MMKRPGANVAMAGGMIGGIAKTKRNGGMLVD
jgi:hypothetical protein